MGSSYQQTLPEQFSMATLEKNLAALAQVDEPLVSRICLPVNGDHVHFLRDGKCQYQIHRTLYPFSIRDEDLSGTLGETDSEKNILLFGLGLGEQLDYLLKRFKKSKITAWGRDPWLVRLVLMQRDYSKHLRSGRLQLCMGVDILNILNSGNTTSITRSLVVLKRCLI